MTSLGGITLGTKLKMPILTFYLPHNLQIRILYFRSLCIRDTVSNKTYQNFREKRLVRPGSKYPIWQRSQSISYKAKFSQRDNIYLVGFKCTITYQNIRGKTKVRSILCPEKPKMAKTLPNNLHGWAIWKIMTFAITKKVYQ